MKQHWLTALLIAALIPYGIICFYALPFGDDFCFGWTASQHVPFLQKFLNQYLQWNGRYTSDVLINLHPILTGKLWVLQTVLLASLLCTPMVWYILCRQLIGEKRIALITALLITLFYLCYMPQLTEGIYWYGGIVNYHLGNVALLLHVAAFVMSTKETSCISNNAAIQDFSFRKASIRNDKSVLWPLMRKVLCIALLVVAIGFNEIAAVLLPLVYLFATLYTLRTRHPLHKTFFYLLVVALIAAGFVVFAPGNMVRMEVANGGHQLFHSIFYALLQTGRFLAKWIFNYPALALCLLLVMYANEWKQKLSLQINWRITLGFVFAVLFLSAFIPYYATGILGQHRTINYAFFFVMPLLAYSVVQVAAQYKWPQKLNTLSVRLSLPAGKAGLSKPVSKSAILFSIVIALLFTGNSLLIIKDFAQGKFAAYNNQFMQRQFDVKKGVKPYALKTVPAVFCITDAVDSTYWVDMCIENYYNQGVGLE